MKTIEKLIKIQRKVLIKTQILKSLQKIAKAKKDIKIKNKKIIKIKDKNWNKFQIRIQA